MQMIDRISFPSRRTSRPRTENIPAMFFKRCSLFYDDILDNDRNSFAIFISVAMFNASIWSTDKIDNWCADRVKSLTFVAHFTGCLFKRVKYLIRATKSSSPKPLRCQ